MRGWEYYLFFIFEFGRLIIYNAISLVSFLKTRSVITKLLFFKPQPTIKLNHHKIIMRGIFGSFVTNVPWLTVSSILETKGPKKKLGTKFYYEN